MSVWTNSSAFMSCHVMSCHVMSCHRTKLSHKSADFCTPIYEGSCFLSERLCYLNKSGKCKERGFIIIICYCPVIPGFTRMGLRRRSNGFRVRTVLKSPWILGEVLEKSLNSIFPWKVLKFLCKSLKRAWIFFNFECSSLERIFWCFLVVQDRI